MNKRENKRANALIISLGVMMLLSMVGMSFIRLSISERNASANYSDMVNSKLLGSAGIMNAVAKLRADFKQHLFAHLSEDWVYRWADSYTYGSREDRLGDGIPITNSYQAEAHPSYCMTDKVLGRYVSGYIVNKQKVFNLKITDTTSQIELNSHQYPITTDDPGDENNPLVDMLFNLSKAIAEYNPEYTGDINGPLHDRETAVNILKKRRELGEFGSKWDLLMVDGISREDLKYLWDYICVANKDKSREMLARNNNISDDKERYIVEKEIL